MGGGERQQQGIAGKRARALRKELRLADRRRQKQPFSMAGLRIGDLNRFFTYRWGHELPDDDAGRDDARIMAHHLAWLQGDPERRITNWLDLRAPWMNGAERAKLIAE